MTRRERHEIAQTVAKIMSDGCSEIRTAWLAKMGDLKGLGQYVRNMCTTLWTDCNPYLDKEYVDYAWLKVGNRIINYDDVWCYIRDDIKRNYGR